MISLDSQIQIANPLAASPRLATKTGEYPIMTFDDMFAVARTGTSDRKPAEPCQVGVVRLALRWIAKKAAKCPLGVRLKGADDTEPDRTHELVQIWDASNPTKLIQRVLDDLYLHGKGNALLYKVRDDASKRVVKLWPLNIKNCERDKILGVWKYNSTPLLPDNLVWISLGADPDDPDLGVDQWQGFEDDLRTLREEGVYTADVLVNGGVVGLAITKDDPQTILSSDAIKRLRREAKDMTTGQNRGSALVSGTGLRVQEIGSTPEKMALDKLTQGAQARVAGNLQVALMVLGLSDPGKTYSNLQEANKGSYRTAVIGFHDVLAEALGRDLLPDVGSDPRQEEVVWIYEDQEEFQEDLDRAATRIVKLVGGPILTPNEGRAKLGEPPSDDPSADMLAKSSAQPQPAPAP